MEKNGVSLEWTGERYVPKSVEAYLKDEIDRWWSDRIEVRWSFTSVGTGAHTIALPNNNVGNLRISEMRKFRSEMKTFQKKMEDKMRDDAMTFQDEIKGEVRDNAIQVTSCTYRFQKPDRNFTGSYVFDTRRKDDQAVIISSNQNCLARDRQNPEIRIVRDSQGEWQIEAKRWTENDVCGRPLTLSLLFINGGNVERNVSTCNNVRCGSRWMEKIKSWGSGGC